MYLSVSMLYYEKKIYASFQGFFFFKNRFYFHLFILCILHIHVFQCNISIRLIKLNPKTNTRHFFLFLSFRAMVWHVSKVTAAHSPELQSLHFIPRWSPSRIPEPGIKLRHLSMWIKISIDMYIHFICWCMLHIVHVCASLNDASIIL